MKVFISSVISGMEEFRDATARAIRALGHEVIRAEDFGALPDSPQVSCLAGVRGAEAVILLLGWRYGPAQSSGLSATHEEYREARERCPVLIMVQDGADREDDQAQFVAEVRDWAQGHYTESFTNADQLRDAVTGALHSLELASATGPVDPDEMLARATGLLPCSERSYGHGIRLAFALTGGPLQTVLRPAELEAQELRERLQQIALFGQVAVLTPQQGTDIAVEHDSLIFNQPDQQVSIAEDGSICLQAKVPDPEMGLHAIIEEDVREIIGRFLRFSDAVLAAIDPVNRLSHVAVTIRFLDTGHFGWRTRAEHERRPDRVSMTSFPGEDHEAVHLSPPHRTRPALRQNVADMAEDLTVKLRRALQGPGRSQW